MKKLILSIITVITVLSFVGCSDEVENKPQSISEHFVRLILDGETKKAKEFISDDLSEKQKKKIIWWIIRKRDKGLYGEDLAKVEFKSKILSNKNKSASLILYARNKTSKKDYLRTFGDYSYDRFRLIFENNNWKIKK